MKVLANTVMAACVCVPAFASVSASALVKHVVSWQDGRNKLVPLKSTEALPYGQGYARTGNIYICDNGIDTTAKRGVLWYIELNQSSPAPVLATVEAAVEEWEGVPDHNFSLWLDVTHADGTKLYQQCSAFTESEKEGWHRLCVSVLPTKPIRRVSYFLLFRKHAGLAKFRNPCFTELPSEGIIRFDCAATRQIGFPKSGFLLRDIARESGFVSISREALGVRLTASVENCQGAKVYDVVLEELTGRDRALTLVYTIPLDKGRLVWFEDPRREIELTQASDEVMNVSLHQVGANGLLSRYPFGAVATGNKGLAIGLDPATPVYFRTGCQPKTRELFLACDIGLAPEKPFAHFRFCVFDFQASDGFRGALSRYYTMFLDCFAVRIKEQGVWMPFARISKVTGWSDFGFRFKEGGGETKWDDEHGVLTFRYTEPMTWWMRLNSDVPRTVSRAENEARRLAREGDKVAKAWLSSAFEDQEGKSAGRFLSTPWCDGVVWSMNSAPGVQGEVTDFSYRFSSDYLDQAYGPSKEGECDGEYIDSCEGSVTDALDFRRSHFACMERPLCYSRWSRRTGVFKGMIGFEYVRSVRKEMLGRKKFVMGNGTPTGWFWMASLLDVMGKEVDWYRDGKWTPMAEDEMLYRRVLCRGKPFCFLMNTDFSVFPYEASEKFMKRALAYGMFPGYFSADAATKHYFSSPELYNRDRPLFKKYLPLCKLVAEAGWEPLTGATSDNAAVAVERFGKQPGVCYLTVYNHDSCRQTALLKLGDLKTRTVSLEYVTEREMHWKHGYAKIELDAWDVRVIELHGNDKGATDDR